MLINFKEPNPPGLSKRQSEIIVDCKDPNICVVAGPAVGKTRLIHAKAFKAWQDGMDPQDILPLAFQVTARDVLRKRLDGTGVRAYTIHGQHLKDSEEGRNNLIKSGFSDFPSVLRPRKPREKYYELIIVDEGQDLTKEQYESILTWGRNFFMVGDPWQAIFMWAGADPGNLTRFSKEYCNGKKLELMENFRSARRIVEISNKFSGRDSQWGGENGEGYTEISSKIPIELDNVTILTRTKGEFGEYQKILYKFDIPYTMIVSKDMGREAFNFKGGISTKVDKPEDYKPTLLLDIHCAKGDEWDNVWLINNPLFFKGRGNEEEHIFYVGLTRARKKLYIHTHTNSDFIRRLE